MTSYFTTLLLLSWTCNYLIFFFIVKILYFKTWTFFWSDCLCFAWQEIGDFENWMKTMEFDCKSISAAIYNIHQSWDHEVSYLYHHLWCFCSSVYFLFVWGRTLFLEYLNVWNFPKWNFLVLECTCIILAYVINLVVQNYNTNNWLVIINYPVLQPWERK